MLVILKCITWTKFQGGKYLGGGNELGEKKENINIALYEQKLDL